MHIKRIMLKDYRNYPFLKRDFNKDLNIVVGENAQGKTNLIESIYYIGLGKSYRTAKDNELIRWGNEKSSINAIIKKNEKDNERNNENDIDVKINIFKIKKKEIFVNDVPNRKLKDFLGLINVVIFSPEDLDLVKGSPVNRRKFLDNEISQINPSYNHDLSQYNRIVFQRNNLLKEYKTKKEILKNIEVWDYQLIEYGSKVIKKRMEIIKKLSILSRLTHRKITNGKENLKITYKSSFPVPQNLLIEDIKKNYNNKLIEKKDEEVERKMTLIGPHRDDLIFLINDIPVREFGSQGQQRTTALALKLSELELVKSEKGEYPILLLDDVLSELDENRKKFLLDYITKVQTFITLTSLKSIDFKNYKGNYKIYKVKEGELTELIEDGRY